MERKRSTQLAEHRQIPSNHQQQSTSPLFARNDRRGHQSTLRYQIKLGINVNAMTTEELNLIPRNTIRVRLGTTWLPADEIKEFSEQLLSHAGTSTVKFHPDPANIWVIKGGSKLTTSPKKTNGEHPNILY
jgi:hypothetical protein